MDKKEDNKPGGPGDRLPSGTVGTVAVKVNGEKIAVQTIDGKALVEDIIKAAGGKPGQDELNVSGDNTVLDPKARIKVREDMDFSLSEKGRTPLS